MKSVNKFAQFMRPLYLLPLLTAFVIGIYIISVRPLLIPEMATVKVELAVAGLLLLFLGVGALVFLGSLLFTLVVAVRTRQQERLRPWRARLLRQLTVIVTLVILLAATTLLSQALAYTPPIVGDDGKPIPGSIATLEKVDLGDTDQWITLRGKSTDSPVLLFLAGGPGGSQLAATRSKLSELEDHFIVVNWEQPGSGKSYNAVPHGLLTPERYISDAHQLALYLCERFDEEKIYVVGESWGSALGIWLAQSHPELVHAFIGTGQMVDFTETDIYCYELAKQLAQERGDRKKSEALESQGPPPYYGKGLVWKEAAFLMYLSEYMNQNPAIAGGYDTIGDVAGPEYGLYDKLNYVRGMTNTFSAVYPQLWGIDLRQEVPKLDVPAYFIHGRHDINAPQFLAEEYYELLDAPYKELIWFERSGHSPWVNEPAEFVNVIANKVLADTITQ